MLKQRHKATAANKAETETEIEKKNSYDNDSDDSDDEYDEDECESFIARPHIVVLHDSTRDLRSKTNDCCPKYIALGFSRLLQEIEDKPLSTVCLMTLMFFMVIFGIVTGVGHVVHKSSNVGEHSPVYGLKQLDYIKFPLCIEGKFQCACNPPLKPLSKRMYPWWEDAHILNKQSVEAVIDANGADGIDVVFLGDSITERWSGSVMGDPNKLPDLRQTFDKFFDKESGGKYQGIALGIAGDRSPNLLWRITHGEIDHISPKIWWLLIGTNDLADDCSPDATLIGILNIVKELRARKPSATIVINGILPSSSRMGGELPPKDTPGSGAVKWPSILDINARLKDFCVEKGGDNNIEYFDASNVFVAEIGTKKFKSEQKYILKELMDDYLHPTALGYTHWAEEIEAWLESRLDK